MWKSILDTITKGLASDDPKLVEQILQANVDFDKWVQYYNPNDISSIKETEKIVVKILSEDLQDLKIRSAYFAFLVKKTNDLKTERIWTFIHDTINEHFWIFVRSRYKLWEYPNIGMRDGFQIVSLPCNHEMPDVIKKMFGLE